MLQSDDDPGTVGFRGMQPGKESATPPDRSSARSDAPRPAPGQRRQALTAATLRAFARVIDGLPDAIVVVDETGVIVALNQHVEHLTGYAREELLGSAVERLMPARLRAAHVIHRQHYRARPYAREMGAGLDLVAVRKDGTEVPVEISLSPMQIDGRLHVVSAIRDVTQRRQAAVALRESEERFRLLVEGVTDYALFMLTADGRVAGWNAGAQRLMGYRAEEIVGAHVSQFYPAEAARAGEPEHNLRVARQSGRMEAEGWRVRKDGTRFRADIMLTAIRDADGAVRGFAKLVRDRTGHWRTEQALRFLAETSTHIADTLEYRGALEAVTHAVIPYLADWCCVYVRPLGTAPARVAAAADPSVDAVLQALVPDWPAWAEQGTKSVTARALRSGAPLLLNDLPAGYWLEVTPVDHAWQAWQAVGARALLAVPLRSDHAVLGVLTLGSTTAGRRFEGADVLLAEEVARRAVVAIDHARLFEAEQEARQTAERLAAEQIAILNQIADGVLIADPSGQIRFANAAARRFGPIADPGMPIAAKSRLGLLQMPDGKPVQAEDLPLRRALGGEVVSGVELVLRLMGNAERALRCSAAPVRTNNGALFGAVAIYHDITDQRALDRQKDEFVANTSHDLRTPLATIGAAIELILANEPTGTSELIHRLFVSIDAATARMSKLVEDLLELTRLQAGRVQLQRERCDLRALLLHALQVIEPLTAARGQHLERKLPDASVWITADAERLERAVFNLLDNARKHAPEHARIRLTLAGDSEHVVVVEDDGPGIPPEEQAQIFDRFYQGRRSSRNEGSGLGLPIARAMVELHGGRLEVESAPGVGSRFTIILPAAAPTSDGERRER